MDVREMICIGCPMGCALTVTINNNETKVEGNQCKIGETYGKEEVTNPTRNITTSVPVIGGDISMVSVKTSRPIPKAAIMDCARATRQLTAYAPVAVGDVILHDVAGTGIDMIATRAVPLQTAASDKTA